MKKFLLSGLCMMMFACASRTDAAEPAGRKLGIFQVAYKAVQNAREQKRLQLLQKMQDRKIRKQRGIVSFVKVVLEEHAEQKLLASND